MMPVGGFDPWGRGIPRPIAPLFLDLSAGSYVGIFRAAFPACSPCQANPSFPHELPVEIESQVIHRPRVLYMG